ncbi:MAG: phosphate ABC transporter permease subunit PstC [Rhodobacteraceae bacterium]|nr:phosphate ABC transporter permease subunit PstC [Paracoccaceae bacterium]
MASIAFIALFLVVAFSYIINWRAARTISAAGERLNSVPKYHAIFAALIVGVPVLALLLIWLMLRGPFVDFLIVQGLNPDQYWHLEAGQRQLTVAEIKSISSGRVFGTPEDWKIEAAGKLAETRNLLDWLTVAIVTAAAGALLVYARIKVKDRFRARAGTERIVSILMIFCSLVAIFTTLGIIASLLVETLRFLSLVPITEFLFGLNWEPQIPIREDQVAAEGAFGWIPVILGTIVITIVALFLAVPIGIMSAIYLNEFASNGIRAISKPLLEILAGVPTVVYGFFAVLVIAPALRNAGAALNIPVAPNTALAAGGVMGIMLIPFISSLSDDALTAVPTSLRDGALALGATRAETVIGVIFPAALPGIMGGVLLAVSRAIGETMIVVMAAGLIAKLTLNPLDSVTTVTVQIVTLLIGDTSFDNPKTLSAFALGLMLFLMTLIINIAALRIVHKFHESYD